jgi:hypothetical protein
VPAPGTVGMKSIVTPTQPLRDPMVVIAAIDRTKASHE